MPSQTLSIISVAAGDLTVAHGLGVTPEFYEINMTSGGELYWQTVKFDASNVYLVASDVGVTAAVFISSSLQPIPNPNSYPQVSDILGGVENDLRQEINETDNPAILIDYVNRVSLQMMRYSRWQFMLSAPKRFVTQMEQTDYWVGAVGAAADGTVDTQLDCTDLGIIREGTVYDRSNFRLLKRITEAPNISKLEFADIQSRPGRPRLWRNAPDTPFVFNVYPAPNNQNNYQSKPSSPIVTYTAGGSLAARIEYYKISYVDALGGESLASDLETRVYIPANYLAVVQAPVPGVPKTASGVPINQYNVYASTASGQEQLQNASPISTSAVWPEPSGGLISGTTPLGTPAIETLWGYVIEFRYYKKRLQLTALTDYLQVPLEYKDIVIAGVDALGWILIGKEQEAQAWLQRYTSGLTEMIKDKNLFPKGGDFMQADPSSVTSVFQPSLETYDVSSLLTL